VISPRLFARALPLAGLVLAAACAAGCTHSAPVAAVAPAAPAEKAAPQTKDQTAVVPIDPDDPVWGSPTALVTLVEFADFECSFCKKVEPTIAQLKKTYGPDKLRIVWKHFPLGFHPHARPASQAASAVFSIGGADAFWKFHDALLPEPKMGDTFDAEAQAAGVDPATLHAKLASGFPAEKVAHDMALGEKLGVDGTPAFFINGAFVSGALPIEVFQEAIDETMKQAKAVLDKGTPRDDLYVTVSKINFTPPGSESASEEPNEPPEDTTSVWKVPVGASPSKGPAAAPVTLVFFGDFQCPFCAQADATVKLVEKEYEGKLRVVWKNFPLSMHPRAEPAAELAFEARAEKGDAGFWNAHDRLFASQVDLGDESLLQIAGEMGLDRAKVKRAIEQHTHRAAIQADQRLGVEIEAEGAPQTFINGRRIVGAQPAGAFRALIQAELDHAAAMVKSGTAPAAVYETILAEGKTGTKPEQKTIELPAALAKLPVRGPANAKVSIVEFADFQCSYCIRAESTVRTLIDEHGGNVQLVWINRPLDMHPHAEMAAEAAEEAYRQKGNAGFWPLHDALFAHGHEANGLTLESILGYTTAQKLDADRMRAALTPVDKAPAAHRAIVDRDGKVADAAGFNGTPTFVIVGPAGKKATGSSAENPKWTGYVVAGAQEPGAFLYAIDLALHDGTPTAGAK
jgi:protein-disulfide isomerase